MWTRFDADGRSFLNLNRPEDLTRAAQLVDGAQSPPPCEKRHAA